MGPRAQAWGTAAIANISGGGTLAYDGPYWQQRAPGNFVGSAARNGIPTLMWLGWNDLVTTGGPSLYTEYQNAADHRPVDAPMTPGQPVTGRDQRALDHARTWHDRDGVDIRPQQTFRADQYLTPGSAVRLDFTLSPRVMTVEPGDSLRLVITTQAPAAGCALTPHSCENEANELPCVPTAPQAATLSGTYQIDFGPAMASAINLPLLPAGALQSAGTSPAPLNWG